MIVLLPAPDPTDKLVGETESVGELPPVTATLVNVAVVSVPSLCEVAKNPTYTLDGNAIVTLPICVQLVPLVEEKPVSVLPDLVIRT